MMQTLISFLRPRRRLASASLEAFLDARCIRGGWVPFWYFYAAYEAWALKNQFSALPVEQVVEVMQRLGFTTSRIRRIDARQIRSWEGVSLQAFSAYMDAEEVA